MPQHFGAWIVVWFLSFSTLLSAAEPTKAVPYWTPRDGDVLVLLGDDVTAQAGYSQLLENFFLCRYPDRLVQVVNAGVQGSLTRDAIERFSDDVASHHPTHVAVMLGLSDAGFEPYRQERFEEFQRNIAELHRRIRALGAQPIYMSPAMFDAEAARRNIVYDPEESLPLIDATLSYYGVWLREFAAKNQAKFVDVHGAMSGTTRWTRSRNPEFTMLPDGHQPNEVGQLVIASTLLRELGLAQALSSIQIQCDSEMPTAIADGGQVRSLLTASPNSVTFEWQAAALPWAIPLEDDTANRWQYLAEPFNRETLRIQGLVPGTYELLIDNRLTGQFSARDFEKGVRLNRLSTPQREQAELLADRNAERAESLIRPARDDWSIFQQHCRLRQELHDFPDDVELVQAWSELERSLVSFSSRQARWTTAAEISLALLLEQAQPLVRQILIRPLSTAEVEGRVLIGGVPVPGAQVEYHDSHGLSAFGTTDAMGFYRLTARVPAGIHAGEGWLVVFAHMILPKFISVEQSGHRVTLRSGSNEIELHFESNAAGQ